jgi:hypothetical protein
VRRKKRKAKNDVDEQIKDEDIRKGGKDGSRISRMMIGRLAGPSTRRKRRF